MGVLDIRMRSQRLGNIGAVREVAPPTGGAAAWAAVAKAAERMGSGLDAANRGVLAIAGEFKRQRDERLGEAIDDYQRTMTEFNDSESTAVIGDPGDWQDMNIEYRKKTFDRVCKDHRLNGDMAKELERKVLGFDTTMMNGWTRRAATVRADRAVGTAASNMAKAITTVTSPNATPEAWADYAQRENELILAQERKAGRTLSEEERAAVSRKHAGEVAGAHLNRDIAEMGEMATAAESDGSDGEKVFDDKIKELDDADRVLPKSSFITVTDKGGKERNINFLKRALGDERIASMRDAAVKEVKKAKAEWKAAYDAAAAAAAAKRKKEAVDGAHRKMIELYTGKKQDGSPILPPLDENDPKSVVAHYGTIAEWENAIGESLRAVAPAEADTYIRSARRTALHGANKASELELKRNDEKFLKGYKDPTRLGDALSGAPKMTPGEAILAAVYAHSNNLISDAAYTQALEVCSKAVDSDNDDFIAAACDAIGYACPGLLSSKKGEIVINRSLVGAKDKRNPEAADTGIDRVVEKDAKWLWRDETEDVTLGQLRQALQIFTRQIREDEKNNAWTVQKRDEYLKRFKELIKPTVEDWRKRKLQERLDEIDRAFGVPRPQGGNAIEDIRLPH